jgi:hypothetical protein
VLFTPDAHEALADEPWSAEGIVSAIASIVADAERESASCCSGGGA